MVQIKKYGNRRLYDTGASRYITLDELEAKVKKGTEVQVVDAKTGEDLTQATLVQVIIEGRGAGRMLPIPLLLQLIRLSNHALGEFMGRYLAGALELYIQAQKGAQALAPFSPFSGTIPVAAAETLSKMMGTDSAEWTRPAEKPRVAPQQKDDVSRLRQELDALKESLRKRPRKR